MPRDNPARHFIITFIIALAIYVISYGWIEHRRYRKGPWEITFTNNAAAPALIINQPALGLTNVILVFEGSTNAASLETNSASNQPTRLEFRTPRQTPFDVPFGKCVFEDLTFLPGTVTFQMFGHEIELLPRVLIIDQKEHPWQSSQATVLNQSH